MDCDATMHDFLEHMLHDASVEPTQLPLSFLKVITNNFSDGQQIGSGGFAVVYKGLLNNGTVAVKKLSPNFEVDEKTFNQEVDSLMRVKHENIVRFLGYCSDTQGKVHKYEGKNVIAEERQRLLCFEFMPKGSLDKYVNDATQGLDWRTRYNIIKGVCEGLYYLHQNSIVHLDLKPANILLNYYMVPRIADFGISRCFDEKQTRAATLNLYGTLGYMAPEFYDGVITFKSDVYSLGIIIIEMLTGRKGYPNNIDDIIKRWSTRFGSILGDLRIEHIKACVEMGIQCIDPDPKKRPTTQDIIDMLVEMEYRYGFNETDFLTSSATHVLDVYPLYIWFPLEPNELIIRCPVTLTNRTDDLIGVCIKPTCPDACSNPGYPYVWEQRNQGENDTVSSLFRRLGPHSSETIYMTRRKQQHPPLLQAEKGIFDVVMVATKSEKDLKRLDGNWKRGTWTSEDPLGEAKDLGTVVLRATLRAAVSSDPTARCLEPEEVVHQFTTAAASGHGWITCVDVHPTKTWLVVGQFFGHVSIWNYETQEIVIMLEIKSTQSRFGLNTLPAIKFIAGDEWFSAGDGYGCVHVYAYDKKVKEFQAHRRSIGSLAVHPKHTLLVTTSALGSSIKLWDWSQGWTCARVINTHTTMNRLMVGPRDTSTFASCDMNNNTIKVWDIHSSSDIPIATFEGQCLSFYTDKSYQHIMATISSDIHTSSHIAKIWDFQTKKHVHTLHSGTQTWDRGIVSWALRTRTWKFDNLTCHPTLPVLAGIVTNSKSNMRRIVLWDVRTYRVMKRFELLIKGDYCYMMAFDGKEDITSLVVATRKEVSVIKINVHALLTGGSKYYGQQSCDKSERSIP